jgi:hypothetical protein
MFEIKVVEKIKTHILCSRTFSPENHSVYEIMWENVVEPQRSQMTIYYSACTFHAGQIRL